MVTVQIVSTTNEAWRSWLRDETGKYGWWWDEQRPPGDDDVVLTHVQETGLLVWREVGCRVRRGRLEPGEKESDPLEPPVFLRDVMRRVGHPTPRRARAFVGDNAERLLSALSEEQAANPNGPTRREGRRRTKADLYRDGQLRTAAIDNSKGVCP